MTRGFKKGYIPWNKNTKGLTHQSSDSIEKLRISKLGNRNPNFGKSPWNKGIKNPYRKETLQVMSDSHKGKKQSKETINKRIAYQYGKKWSHDQRIKFSLANQGNKNWNWKGGITSLRDKIYKTFNWRQWRSDIFQRDNFTCQDCGQYGGYLEAHHIKEFIKILQENNIETLEQAIICQELWNINNGKTLCNKCHNKTKRGRGTLK